MRNLWFILVWATALVLTGCAGFSPRRIEIGIEVQDKPAPTYAEAKEARKSEKVLINGVPVDKTKYAAIVRIRSASGAGCTATLIGPKTLITAAHCVKEGEKVSFTAVTGVTYTGVGDRHIEYPGKDVDIALIYLDKAVEGIKPMSIRSDRFETKGMKLNIFGYGCTQPGGSGGNDGVLRTGIATVTGATTFDLISTGAGLCYGDSGGPVFYEDEKGVLWLIGINSKGNIKDTNYTTRLTLPITVDWLKKRADEKGVAICGINVTCNGEDPPGPMPGDYYPFRFEIDLPDGSTRKIEGKF